MIHLRFGLKVTWYFLKDYTALQISLVDVWKREIVSTLLPSGLADFTATELLLRAIICVGSLDCAQADQY